MTPPLTKGGSNYYSERLVVRGNLILVKPTKRHLFCMSLFGLVGLFFVVFPCLMEQRIIWPGVIFGGVFFLLGCSIFIGEIRKPHPLINLSLRQLYPQGMKQPSLSVPLNSFSQLEIVDKDIHNPKGQGYPCYELNVVLKDGSRHNILNHGNFRKIREDARLLADILNLQIQENDLPPQKPLPQVRDDEDNAEPHPLTNSGSNSRSERLVVRGNIIKVSPTKRNLLPQALFGLFGLFAGLLPTYIENKIIWPLALFGGVFFLLGCVLFIAELRKPRPLLNLSLLQFYPKGMKHPNLAVSLNNITHLEILSKIAHFHTKSGTHSFTCYELNVVLNDGSRYNLLNHSDKKALTEDAHLLAEILNLQIQED